VIGGQELVAVGLNHRTAPVEMRERFAVVADDLPGFYAALREGGRSEELVVLSTCNRVELYALVPEGDEGAGLVNHLARSRGVRARKLRRHVYRHRGEEAVRHIFRVACSLDSMVLGEPQILGQMKAAIETAGELDAVGRILGRLMRRAVTVAKRVRTETRIGREPVSMGAAGVELARQVFGSLEGRVAMLIGAGEMGRLVARALLSRGVDEVVVANRTFSRGVALADEFAGTAVRIEQMPRYLEQVDIVLASTDAGRYLLDRASMGPVMRARRFRPLFCVDLSVPRNIDPAVNELEGAFVFNVDDLAQVTRRGEAARKAEASRAEAIVREEAVRCYRSLGARAIDPVIAGMTRRAESIRQIEIRRSRATLDALDPKARGVVEAMTRAMFKRHLHRAIQTARRLGEEGDAEGLAVLKAALSEEQEDG